MLTRILTTSLLTVSVAAGANAQAPQPSDTPHANIIDLGENRYGVGQIEIDRKTQSFSVPGTVIDLGPPTAPIEFLVIQRGGMKAYESLLGIDADAIQFNLACILIGLDAKRAQHSSQPYDNGPVEGDRVSLTIEWKSGDQSVRHSLGELLRVDGVDKVTEDWVYTGSSYGPTGEYAAQALQVIVGAMHEPWSIIQHHSGLGVGHYGAITYDPDVMPKPKTPILLRVQRLDNARPPPADASGKPADVK
jgi:hypothetical protein